MANYWIGESGPELYRAPVDGWISPHVSTRAITGTSQGWSRPVTPAHALAFLALCAVGGGIVGVGLTAFFTSTAVRRLANALR